MAKTTDELFRDVESGLNTGFRQQQAGTYEKFSQGDDGRWTGKVIDNDDPEKLGRVKIMVFGYYDELSEYAIPWAVPDIGYIGGSNGSFIIPENGTFLRGYFDQGDIQKPIYDSVAFSEITARNLTRNFIVNKLEDYPNKMVLMETDAGDYLTLNKASGETLFHHRSGLNITVDANGSLTINTGALYMERGKLVINCNGDTEISTHGDTSVTSEFGNITVDSKLGFVMLGRNEAKQLVNNFPICPITGMPHNTGNTNVIC